MQITNLIKRRDILKILLLFVFLIIGCSTNKQINHTPYWAQKQPTFIIKYDKNFNDDRPYWQKQEPTIIIFKCVGSL